jgi:hypothetical protein
VPRILATILNGTIITGMVVLLHRCRTARLVLREEEDLSSRPHHFSNYSRGLQAARTEQRYFIAAEPVRIHTAINGVPANFVHSIFLTYPRDRGYVAANRSPVASILGIIRAGRAPDSDLSVALHEVAPSQAMENGTIMPEIGHEETSSRLCRSALVDSRRRKQPVPSATSDAMLDPQPADTCTT